MIIPVSNSPSKVEQLGDTGISAQSVGPDGYEGEDPPPSYTPAPDANSVSGIPDMAPPMAQSHGPPPQKPTNMVSISKLSGSVKGTWVIDPAIVIPAPLLPTLALGEMEQTRRNLYLKTNNGGVTADVTLVPRTLTKDGRQRVTLAASTLNGAVKFALREAWTHVTPRPARLPVKLTVDTLNGAISVTIPRSFRGIIIGSTYNGSIKLSEELQAQVQYEKMDGRSRRVFIGDFDQDDFTEGNEWSGDEVIADTKSGTVKLRYEDERENASDGGGSSKSDGQRSPGVLTRIFAAIF